LGRHAFGDQYKATDIVVNGPGRLELVFTPKDGSEKKNLVVYDFEGPGVALAMYNHDEVCPLWTNDLSPVQNEVKHVKHR
jgi:isocitrate dehydrogenase